MQKRSGFGIALALLSGVAAAQGAAAPGAGEWHSLFNGNDLSGWTIKINKHPLGENYRDTFRVEDGVIKVSVRPLRTSSTSSSAICIRTRPTRNYILRLEYKITGKAVADSPPWAKLNSGVMIHSQSPLTMGLNQAWPASMEVPVPGRRRHRGQADRQRLHARHQSRDEGQAAHRSHHRLDLEAVPAWTSGCRWKSKCTATKK